MISCLSIFFFQSFEMRRRSDGSLTPILTTLLYGPSQKLFSEFSEVEFLLMSEWNSKKLFSESEARLVNFDALLSENPVMIIEMGKEEFGVGVKSHKDLTKSLALIAQCCSKFALKLGGKCQNFWCFDW